jgi:amino-acid N-acetyltransferase
MIRVANFEDLLKIQELINTYASKGEMLSLGYNEIAERILEFVVWEENNKILGCCALHPSWEYLAEIRSLAVNETAKGKGIGRKLVEYCLDTAKHIKAKKVFALTYQVNFFKKLGFEIIEKEKLPQKIWSDCIKCIKFPNCDEIAVIMEMERNQ